MSVAGIATRVAEIRVLLGALSAGPAAVATAPVGSTAATASAPPAASATSFGSQLAAATAGPAVTAVGDATPYDAMITAAAQRHGIDPALLKALIRAESDFDPNAGSAAGAQGLTQLMPGTAAALGVTDVHDPRQAIEGGARYLSQQLQTFGGDVTKALAAYNAGPGAVQRYGGVPPYAETQAYVRKVLGYAAEYRTGAPATATTAAAPAAATTLTTPIVT